ncbi:hypothetical protein IOLA_045 [uncultured bacterium]|nr:hypothetical protein IOLA_045 [uncultured bacterium]
MHILYLFSSFIITLISIILYFLYLKYLDLIIYYKYFPFIFKYFYYNQNIFFIIFDIFNRYEDIMLILKINDDSIINIINNKQLSELVSYFIDNSFNKVFVTLIKILNICVS